MKRYGGVEVIVPPFITSALDGGEWSASCPCHFTPGEAAPSKRCRRETFIASTDPFNFCDGTKSKECLALFRHLKQL
jgi:hypothetical protein